MPFQLLFVLSLSACGGGGEDAAPADQTYAPVDMAVLGDTLGEAWGVECDEPLTDMAGYPKVVCPIRESMMQPGMSSNALAIQGFTESSQVDAFRESYVVEGQGFSVGEGWFVTAPNQEIADEAAAALAE